MPRSDGLESHVTFPGVTLLPYDVIFYVGSVPGWNLERGLSRKPNKNLGITQVSLGYKHFWLYEAIPDNKEASVQEKSSVSN